jgi:hypothetical protein
MDGVVRASAYPSLLGKEILKQSAIGQCQIFLDNMKTGFLKW